MKDLLQNTWVRGYIGLMGFALLLGMCTGSPEFPPSFPDLTRAFPGQQPAHEAEVSGVQTVSYTWRGSETPEQIRVRLEAALGKGWARQPHEEKAAREASLQPVTLAEGRSMQLLVLEMYRHSDFAETISLSVARMSWEAQFLVTLIRMPTPD